MVWYDATDEAPKYKVPKHIQVISGGIASFLATTLLHPLDLVKVRLQVHSIDMASVSMAYRIMRCEGVFALFNGVTAGMLRQATFVTTKLAVYHGLYQKHHNKYGTVPGVKDKVAIGMFAGVIGAVAGNPADLVLIRMMADSSMDPCCTHEKKHFPPLYRGAFHAIYKITMTEGFLALWRGASLTLTRSALASVIQIATYSAEGTSDIVSQYVELMMRVDRVVTYHQTRRHIKKHHMAKQEQTSRIHIYSSFTSGFLTAALTLPVDTVKTKYQIRTDKQSQREVFLINLKEHGILYFWRGLIPYYLRLSFQTTFSYFFLVKINEKYISIKKPPKYGE